MTSKACAGSTAVEVVDVFGTVVLVEQSLCKLRISAGSFA